MKKLPVKNDDGVTLRNFGNCNFGFRISKSKFIENEEDNNLKGFRIDCKLHEFRNDSTG